MAGVDCTREASKIASGMAIEIEFHGNRISEGIALPPPI
jgi:hypothetical protein